MINIIICEDDNYQRENLEKIIKDELINLNIELSIVLSTNNPESVINYLDNNIGKVFIYFLDVELKAGINGIELGKIIRKYDSRGYIVFITSHTELSFLAFKYKVQALDYISKYDTSALKNSISQCLSESYNDFKNNFIEEKDTIAINLGNRINNFSLNEILFFETTEIGHKLRIHTTNSQFEFYGKMKELETNLPSFYYKVQRSFIVNITKIKSIDKENNSIVMVNDELLYVSSKNLKGLIEKCLT